jgi:phosphohistidine phosphatase
MAAQARGMKALGIAVDEIITSPYVRARQTADPVAAVYRLADRMTVSEFLEPGGSFKDFAKALKSARGDQVLVVGHAPDLGAWIGELIGVEEIPLRKGDLAIVEMEGGAPKKGSGRLCALLPAEISAAAGQPSR